MNGVGFSQGDEAVIAASIPVALMFVIVGPVADAVVVPVVPWFVHPATLVWSLDPVVPVLVLPGAPAPELVDPPQAGTIPIPAKNKAVHCSVLVRNLTSTSCVPVCLVPVA
jgi:hypothetical protein